MYLINKRRTRKRQWGASYIYGQAKKSWPYDWKYRLPDDLTLVWLFSKISSDFRQDWCHLVVRRPLVELATLAKIRPLRLQYQGWNIYHLYSTYTVWMQFSLPPLLPLANSGTTRAALWASICFWGQYKPTVGRRVSARSSPSQMAFLMTRHGGYNSSSLLIQ